MRGATPLLIAFWALALSLLAALAGAIFASGGTEAALAKAPPAAEAAPPPSATADETVVVGDSPYGPVLFDGRGFALYAFTRDGRGPSRCAGACAEAWPPYVARDEPTAGEGARQALLGTARRADGRRQVTYDGRPLYYYVGDREPGQVLCQNVVEFGGTWLVVRGGGVLVR